MGLPLKDLVSAQELPWEALAGRTLAVDGYNAAYQFLATIRQRDGQLFSDTEGHVTSHLMGAFYRTTSLLEQGVLPVWVFDGKPPERKAGTIRQRIAAKEKAETQYQAALAAGDLETARRKAAQTSRLTRPMVEELVALLSAMGVPDGTGSGGRRGAGRGDVGEGNRLGERLRGLRHAPIRCAATRPRARGAGSQRLGSGRPVHRPIRAPRSLGH